MGKDGCRHQELHPSLPGARRGRYLSLRDHVSHINWWTCVADLLSRHKPWPKLSRDQAVAAALLFRLLTYVLQIPLGRVTYLGPSTGRVRASDELSGTEGGLRGSVQRLRECL
jgi:hypothetical protein